MQQTQAVTVKHAGTWLYTDRFGDNVAAVVRFDLDRVIGQKPRKQFVPLHVNGKGWSVGDPVCRWPLYRLPEVAKAKRVFYCEGEACADTLSSPRRVRPTLPPPTVPSRPKRTDFSPMAGNEESIILPDNDSAGADYGRVLSEILFTTAPVSKIKIINLPGLAEKEDIHD